MFTFSHTNEQLLNVCVCGNRYVDTRAQALVVICQEFGFTFPPVFSRRISMQIVVGVYQRTNALKAMWQVNKMSRRFCAFAKVHICVCVCVHTCG